MKKMYKSAPLPFRGQKRFFVNDFRTVLKRFDNIEIIVDLFGGSGLLSHVAKHDRPATRVIYNDYDNYCDRIASVRTTNEILALARPLLKDVGKGKKVPDEIKRQILSIVEDYSQKGYLDYISLGTALLFSGRWIRTFDELSKETMYNGIRSSGYEVEGYLDGLEITHKDYRELFAEFGGLPNVLFLIDPPYLSTEIGTYNCYWKLKDYVGVLELLNNTQYIYFTSNKSQIIELCEIIKELSIVGNPFDGADIYTKNNFLNYHASFTDMMLVKQR